MDTELKVGDWVYWIYSGDVIEGVIIDLDEISLKIMTSDGYVFGRVGVEDIDNYNWIYYGDVAIDKRDVLKLINKGIDISRATLSAWKESLDLFTEDKIL